MANEPDYILDIRGLATPVSNGSDEATRAKRRWLGVQFECCGVYARIYRNKQETAYQGFCPRCGRPARVRIGSGGTNTRFFRAD